jgi:hypothetical protein
VAEGLFIEYITIHGLLLSLCFSEIPTVTVVEIPNRVTCPLCSGVSSDCPLSTNPAYLYAHPPQGMQQSIGDNNNENRFPLKNFTLKIQLMKTYF